MSRTPEHVLDKYLEKHQKDNSVTLDFYSAVELAVWYDKTPVEVLREYHKKHGLTPI